MKYFKHQTDMSMDVRVKRLIRRYGIEGYGLYNYMLELIVRKLETQSPIPELEETAQDIAGDMNMDTLRVEEIMRFAVEQGLFDYDTVNGRIVATKVYKYLEQSATRSEQLRKMISAWKNGGEKALEDASQTVPDKSEEENRKEKNRREEKKAKHPTLNVPINQTRYDNLCDTYGKDTVDDYIQRAINYCDSKGKKYYADFAAAAYNYMQRDNVQPSKRGDSAQDYEEYTDADGNVKYRLRAV